jgi:SAM-dependent methyltransferase
MKSKRSPAPDLATIMPLLLNLWRRFNKLSGPGDRLQTREFRSVVEAVKVLEAQHDGQQSLVGQDYFANRGYLGAYLLYKWVLHYQQALSLIGELPSPPQRVLDVCSGPAALAFAALRHGATDVYAVDRNVTALELGAEVCGRYGMTLSIRKWDCFKSQLPVDGHFDLISVGYALEELFPANVKGWQELQFCFVQELLRRLTPTGHLLLVENSFPEANRRLLALRDRLVDEGIAIQAPCVMRGACPALKTTNSPCYAQRPMEKPYLLREIQRAASINLGSLKMSYVIFKAPGASWPVAEDKPFYRVISPPIESHQGSRFYLCGQDGKKSLGSRFAQLPLESKAFEYLKRGELIKITGALEQPHGFDIIEGTSVTVESACGKPVPEL